LFRRQYPQHRERLLATADAINDPFEQALIRRNLSPLSFVDVSRDTHTEAMPSAVENRPSLIKVGSNAPGAVWGQVDASRRRRNLLRRGSRR
jgi:hypothetical protein